MRRCKSWLLLLFIPILMPGCSYPPYDEGISLALKTTEKMQLWTEAGPIWTWKSELEGKDYFFIPQKLDPPSRGYVIVELDWLIAFRFVDGFEWRGNNELLLSNEVPTTLNYRIDSIFGGGDSINVLTFDRSDYSNNEIHLFQYDGSNINESTLTIDPPLNLIDKINLDFGLAAATVIGAHSYPDTAADWVFFLCRSGLTGLFSEVRYNADNINAIGSPTQIKLNFPLAGFPPDLENGFYYHNPVTDISYISYYDEEKEKYLSFSWQPADPAPTLTELTSVGKIDAVLSSGELFSRDGNMGVIYDKDGQKQFSFPLGALHFAYETWFLPASEYRLVFTQPVWEDQNQLLFKVYFLPTAELATLD